MNQDRDAYLPAWIWTFKPAQQIYVSPNGSDSNTGLTSVTPLKTTAAAFAKAKPGTRLNFAPGTYGCNASLNNIAGGQNAPVMIISSGGTGLARFNCNYGPGLLFDSVHGLFIEGIELYNANDHGLHIQTTNPAVDGSNLSSDIVVHNSKIHDVTLAAIKNSQSNRFSAVGDTFYNTPGGMMVESVAASNVTLSNNEGYNGFAFDEIKGGALGGIIYRNCIHDAPNGIVVGGDQTGTQFLINPSVNYEAKGIDVWDNVIINTPGFAFRIVGCQQCTIVNNSSWTAAPQAILRIQPDNFANPNGSLIPVYNANLTIENNLFGANAGAGDMITGDTTVQGVGSPGFSFLMKNNAWWWSTGGAPWSDIGYLGDPRSLYWVNPLVTSSPANLTPAPGSPLIGKGAFVFSGESNANGQPFANLPNIGAF
jgi:hypothetical protein